MMKYKNKQIKKEIINLNKFNKTKTLIIQIEFKNIINVIRLTKLEQAKDKWSKETILEKITEK